MTTVLLSGACVFVDESANSNQILTRCLNRFGDFHFLIRDADTVKINFRHDVCMWISGSPVCGVFICIYMYIYIEAKVRSFLPVISPCRLSRQHHWTQKNRKKDCKLLYVHSLLYNIDPWDKISVFKYRLHDKNKDKTDAVLKTSCNAHDSNKKTILSFFYDFV